MKKQPAKKAAAKNTAAKKAVARKTPAKKAGVRRRQADDSGPVTLEQAQALAQASTHAGAGAGTRAAPRALARRSPTGAPAPTPASVGKEQKRLEAAADAERRRRIRDYKETLKIMKQRGVKGLVPEAAEGTALAAAGPRRTGARRAPTAAAGQPLQVFAEGDSWFDYPVPFFGGSIIPRLQDMIRVPILNLASAGDEVQNMLTLNVKQHRILREHLTKGCPAGGPWDALLFSGGGNDIVGDRMMWWMAEYNPAIQAEKHIYQPYFKNALGLVKAGYEELIKLRDECSPGTHLIFHTYDHAIPDGRGVCFKGPWLQPTFKVRKFPALSASPAAFQVVKEMLGQFAKMLGGFASKSRRITVINGQGALPAHPGSWHNELHPSKDGFTVHAGLFHQTLRALFPGRVF